MEVPHPLQTLLQLLVTDASTVANLSYVLAYLSPSSLAPSPHLQKWVTRTTSLMHSKDPAARWAAICIAYRTSSLSKSILVDNAQAWIGIVFPLLSKPEPIPTLKASMRYLSLVFGAAVNHLEFQRQVTTPIVPRVSLALLAIAEDHSDRDTKTLAVQTMAHLVSLYPSLHKALNQRLFALCNQIFGGNAHAVTDNLLLDATAELFASLHFLGGKVGGANLWRNCLDGALQSSWSAWLALRTTFPSSTQLSYRASGNAQFMNSMTNDHPSHSESTADDPVTTTARNLDRLKCGITAINALLRTLVHRPVQVPLGRLAGFCSALLACTADEEAQLHMDPFVRAAEVSAIPLIWMEACHLLSCLTQTAQHMLSPHASRLIMILSSHLEKNIEKSQRCSFLRCASDLLRFCPAVCSKFGVNRLVKATIPSLSPLHLHQLHAESSLGATSHSKMGTKRRREYEADNVFSTTTIMACATLDERNTVLAALDVLDTSMQNIALAPSTHSLTSRVLLSILISLPSVPPSSLSPDPSFHGKVLGRVRDICLEVVKGTSYALGKGTGLVLRSFSSEGSDPYRSVQSQVDLLLHPRRPPFVRTLPFVESLSLSTAEEGAEEAATRLSLGLAFDHEKATPIDSAPPRHDEPVSQDSLVLNQRTDSRTLQAMPLQTKKHADDDRPMEVVSLFAPPAEQPSLQSLPSAATEFRSSLSLAPKAPTPTSMHVAPMLVDEDQEEVPAINLDSDSDG